MEYKAVGRTLFPGKTLLLGINRNEDFREISTVRDRFKVVNVLSGNGVMLIGSLRFPVYADSIIVLNEKDTLVLESSNKLAAQTLYFCPSVLNSFFTLDRLQSLDRKTLDETVRNDHTNLKPFLASDPAKKHFPIPQITRMRISELFDRIEEEAVGQNNKFWPCATRQYLIQLLFLLLRISTQEDGDDGKQVIEVPERMQDLAKIVLYLHTFYHTKITLNSLSREFGTNRTSLSERFKTQFGVTVMNYLANLRVKVAASLLRNTSLSVDEIAFRIGFQDLSHFSKIFKKHFSTTPSDFRKALVQK